MKLLVLTPEKEVMNQNVTSVKVPGTDGQFEILDNHASIVASLGEGQVRIIDTEGKKYMYKITRGFVEVLNNEVSLMVRGLEPVSGK